jgi:signal transduction histidine kinase
VSTESAAALKVSIEHLLEGVQVIGFDWTYLYLNETAARHGRRPAGELIGRRMTDCFPGIDETEMYAALQRVMRTRRAERLLNEFVYPDGGRAWFELLIEPVPDGLCVLSLDVTDRRTTELQLQQARKMEAMGQLTGGIAHDFNNLLTAILGYSEFAIDRTSDPDLIADIGAIKEAGERAARLTRQLLAFSRRHAAAPEVLDLSRLVTELEPMLRRLIPDARIAVSTAGTALVRADPGEVEQVLLNLVVNARDAMPQGGTLRITTGHEEVGVDRLRAHEGVTPGTFVTLMVRDTGHGMTPDVLAQVFDPFFTTKEPGRGTGLGLATVARIVQESGGFITVESVPGAGTTFTAYLRSVDEPLASASASAGGEPPSGSETILVVESDPVVRNLIRKTLADCGYWVLEARDVAGAIALTDRHVEPIQLLITDIILPGLHGSHLAQHLAGRYPGMRVLFVAGFPDTRAHDSGATSPRVSLLAKPFTPGVLARRVRECLDA